MDQKEFLRAGRAQHLGGSVLVLCMNCHEPARSQNGVPPLALRSTIQLPHVHGRIDHLAMDPRTHNVFIAALGNNSVEVVDLGKGDRVASITGIEEPQGIVLIPGDGSVLVTSGGDGSCAFYGTDDLLLKRTIHLDGDADNVRYEPSLERLFVGHGDGGIAVIDARTFAVLTDIPLGGHPESLQVDARRKRLFVNVPERREVDVIDLVTSAVVAHWPLTAATANYPMALDTADQLVIVGCRAGRKLLVYTYAGLLQQSLDGPGDMDDLFYDGAKRTLIAVGGDGTVALFLRTAESKFAASGIVKTRAGARTAALVPEERILLLAVPARNEEPAALWLEEWK